MLWAPYLVATVVAAALVTWLAPQTWDWTETLGPARATIAFALFVVSLLVLETQGYNPFLYFFF